MRRRSYLSLAAAGALAGCLGGDDEESANGNRTGNETTEENGEESGSANGGAPDWERGSFEPLWEQSLGIDNALTIGYDAVAGEEGLFVGHSRGVTAFGLDGIGRWDDERFAEFATLELGDGIVAALTMESELAVFDTEPGGEGDVLPSGQLRWSEDLSADDAVVASTVEAGDGYVAVFDESGLVTYDAETGERLATGPDGNGLYATEELLVVPTTGFDTALVGLDPRSGAERYREESDTPLGETGVLVDGRILAPIQQALDDSELVAIDAGSGLVEWRKAVPNLSAFTGIGAGEGAIAALEDESEEFSETNLELTVFDAADGTRRWSEPLGEVTSPFAPLVDGDTVVAETGDGVAAFDVSSGERLGGTDDATLVNVGVAQERRFFACGTDVIGYGI